LCKIYRQNKGFWRADDYVFRRIRAPFVKNALFFLQLLAGFLFFGLQKSKFCDIIVHIVIFKLSQEAFD